MEVFYSIVMANIPIKLNILSTTFTAMEKMKSHNTDAVSLDVVRSVGEYGGSRGSVPSC